jgi:hypothetical protein
MPARSLVPRLTDMIDAIERVRRVVGHLTIEAVCREELAAELRRRSPLL